jgi:hypothetical protein
MKFQASGFAIDLPDGVMDSSSYVFCFPEIGSFTPTVCIRFEVADQVDMDVRLQEVRQTLHDSFPDLALTGETDVRTRGSWRYFTHVAEFGEPESRMRMKEIQLLIPEPRPTLYVITGTALAADFPKFEPLYDSMVRTFEPNDVQRLN